jgi:hypothetical protein
MCFLKSPKKSVAGLPCRRGGAAAPTTTGVARVPLSSPRALAAVHGHLRPPVGRQALRRRRREITRGPPIYLPEGG